MNISVFKDSLTNQTEPSGLKDYQLSLWHDAKGNWQKAHGLIDSNDDKNSSWVHAYLHRKEGDIGNANYWYRRAGKKRPDISLKEEWESLVEILLA